MREIKFRGKRIDDGLLVFGNCLHQYPDGKVAISHVTKLALTFVDPDSVAQLVGYDKDGREVYEGDKLIRIPDKLFADGTEAVYSAVLFGAVKNPKNGVTKHDIEVCKLIGEGNDD